MKKIFVVTGEVSGDKAAAWYLKKLKAKNIDVQCHAVGGSSLKSSGAILYDRMEKLNVVGVLEIVKRLRFILKFLKNLADHILKNNFDEVVLVDFPGFNLRLAKKLKKANPDIKITYFSPPQVWAWGKWRTKKLKQFCDKLIVLYPFEVEWYKKQGLDVEYWGNPICSKLEVSLKDNFFDNKDFGKTVDQIAIIPASRKAELDKLFPVFADIVKRFKLAYPKVKIILPLAESFRPYIIEEKLRKCGLWRWGRDIEIIVGEKEKLKALSKCCLAITKPGTITLELAMLNIPTVVIYKTSWITYFVAKAMAYIKYMSLPNLLLQKPVIKEFIQSDCKPVKVFVYASKLYKESIENGEEIQKMKNDFHQLKEELSQEL